MLCHLSQDWTNDIEPSTLGKEKIARVIAVFVTRQPHVPDRTIIIV